MFSYGHSTLEVVSAVGGRVDDDGIADREAAAIVCVCDFQDADLEFSELATVALSI